MIDPKNCNDALIVEYNWETYYMEAIFQIGFQIYIIHILTYWFTRIHEFG